VEGSGDQGRENQSGKNKKRRDKREGRKEVRGKDREKTKKQKMIEVKRIAKEWEIWDEEEEVAKSEAEVKKLVSEKFHK